MAVLTRMEDKLGSIRGIPKLHLVSCCRCQLPVVGAPCDLHDAMTLCNREQIAMGKTAEIIPLPVSQIGPVVFPGGQAFLHAADAAWSQRRLSGQIHLREVEIAAQLLALFLRLFAHSGL